MERLTSYFRGDLEAVSSIANSGLDVYAHNIETVTNHHFLTRIKIIFDPLAALLRGLTGVHLDLHRLAPSDPPKVYPVSVISGEM
ncbi:hypothetical protein BDA96_01G308200 [Sorghum bicolor]|uniref:Uncharacterized protein n=2 Tax=Sorghum bicolor TaxID=4558 RepID=A0A921U3K3_SORBI|nr:hypothetical protein BDA96_09G046400 [Sorghum bicolor]KAG0550073.1 hypothetical protein BDA96_01G308200 [Sorghum bicolor]OQU81309.1 hypothetical protein SORBI_3006G038901 [Sorghum bicolor]